MAIRRITISVPETLAERIKEAAGDMPVSQWVTETLEKELDERESNLQWEQFFREVNPSPEAIEWAREFDEELDGPPSTAEAV